MFGVGLGFHNSGILTGAPGCRESPPAKGANITMLQRGTYNDEAPGTHGYRDSDSMNTLPDKKSLIHSLPDESVFPRVIEKRASPN